MAQLNTMCKTVNATGNLKTVLDRRYLLQRITEMLRTTHVNSHLSARGCEKCGHHARRIMSRTQQPARMVFCSPLSVISQQTLRHRPNRQGCHTVALSSTHIALMNVSIPRLLVRKGLAHPPRSYGASQTLYDGEQRCLNYSIMHGDAQYSVYISRMHSKKGLLSIISAIGWSERDGATG